MQNPSPIARSDAVSFFLLDTHLTRLSDWGFKSQLTISSHFSPVLDTVATTPSASSVGQLYYPPARCRHWAQGAPDSRLVVDFLLESIAPRNICTPSFEIEIKEVFILK